VARLPAHCVVPAPAHGFDRLDEDQAGKILEDNVELEHHFADVGIFIDQR